MSRYVRVELPAAERVDVANALAAIGLSFREGDGDERVPLRGSLECAAEPVDFQLASGNFESVEDFGLLVGERVELVCGDVDRSVLTTRFLPRLTQELRAFQSQRLLQAQGMSCRIERDGTESVRVVVERS